MIYPENKNTLRVPSSRIPGPFSHVAAQDLGRGIKLSEKLRSFDKKFDVWSLGERI